MIVARSFSPPSSSLSEKNDLTDRSRRSTVRVRSRSPQTSSSRSPSRSRTAPSSPIPSPSPVNTRSTPVKIPTRNNKALQSQNSTRSMPVAVQSPTPTSRQIPAFKPRKELARDLLSATAIPTRRRTRGRACQRLPNCDHVADFSRLLLDDLHSKDNSLSRTQSLSQLDGLFANIDELLEGQIIVGSEGVYDSTLSARSISSDSLASLASPDDLGSSHFDYRSHVARSLQGRLTPRISHAEDCSANHPLADIDDDQSFSLSSADSASLPASSPPSRTISPPLSPTPKKEQPRSSFKSTLTSSLKALKTAARSTLLSSSGFGHHGGVSSSGLYTNESLLAHNFFDIQPSLTDDRRPPPTMTKPSPELRRYLNPQMASGPPDSPTQLHFWQDERYAYDPKQEAKVTTEKTKQRHKRKRSPAPRSKIDSLPSIVPLSTCLPPTIRTANASSPPIWLTPEGEPISKSASSSFSVNPETLQISGNGMSKNREPRENRDFLRMFVCEMAMRRHGKLSDDISSGRARLWLPPLAGFQSTTDGAQTPRKLGVERWTVWTNDDNREPITERTETSES